MQQRAAGERHGRHVKIKTWRHKKSDSVIIDVHLLQ